MGAENDIDFRFNLLRSLDLFRGFDPAALRLLAKECSWVRYGPTQSLFAQGDECSSMLIVCQGRVSLSLLSKAGRELVLAEAGIGDPLGDVELVLGCGRISNGYALEAVRVLSLRRSVFQRLLQHPTFASAVLQTVCARWRRFARFAETAMLGSLEQRLASLLLGLSEDHGRPVEGGLLIDSAVSQTRMAQLIHASRPKVNVQLRTWKAQGYIAGARNRIVIRDAEALRSIAAHASMSCL